MIKFVKVAAGVALAALMAACGGGGGSAGSTSAGTGGTGGTGGTTGTPKLTLEIVTSSGGAVSTISLGTTTYLRATVTDAAGAKVSGAVVSFGGGSGLVTFTPASGSALTD